MTNGQFIFLIILCLVFVMGWYYAIDFTLTKISKHGGDGSAYIFVSICMGIVFMFTMLIAGTSTIEANNLRKKAPKPKYEEVTFTVYKKK